MNLIRKIFSPIILIISLILLSYTFYKSEIYWNGTKSDFYNIYYIISFLILIFAILSFFLSNKIKDYLIIVCSSVVISFYTFELYLVFSNKDSKNSNNFEIYKKKTGKEYDKRSKFEIYNDLKLIDSDVKVMVYPTNYFGKNTEIFPLSNSSYSKTIYCNENGYYSIYESDRYGFNNPDEEWDKEEIEYLLVGDSFVHGACVNRPDDISSVLRNLSKKNVLNLGFGDNGPLIEYAVLREYLEPNVKKILWVYFEGNDLLEFKDKLSNKILSKYLSDLSFNQGLKNKQDIIDIMTDKLINEEINKRNQFVKQNHFKYRLIKILKIYNIRTLFASQQEPVLLPEFKKIIKLSNNLAIQNNSKLYFIYLPHYSRYKNNSQFNNYHEIKSFIKELNIPFIDIDAEVFKKEKDPLKLFPFRQNGHYTVEGYKKVAKKIFELTR